MTITYRIEVAEPQAHLLRVTLTVPAPAPRQRLSLPVWIPGSYLVREFARHLSALTAEQGGQPRHSEQIDKSTWQIETDGRAALTVRYTVYAFDTSVRTAFVDASRAFLNGSSVCLRVEGREGAPHQVRFGRLAAGWQIATAMPALGPRVFEAADYDELVDHPFELGRFWRGQFTAAGVPHEFVVAGAWPGFDGERLLADTKKICDAQIAFWHGPKGKPPYDRYVFLLNAVEDGYGGLEHRASTALIAARRDLPRTGQATTGDGYATLLGLISHEFFHTWNVKRLKPTDFARLDYGRENYTRLLWFFEGFTSYYDDIFLVRSGLIDAARYLKLVGKTINAVQATPGRLVQSVAASSFDAWVKYYRGDENTPNATVSYYAKGSLVALALDLTLRAHPGRGRGTLDDVMRLLWQRSSGGPIDEAAIAQALRDVAGRSCARELAAWVHGTDDLPLQPLLAKMGVAWKSESAGLASALGLKVTESALTGVRVSHVLRGGAGEQAGLAAGDELLAADDWRLRRLDDLTQWTARGGPAELLVSRDQRVITLRLALPAEPAGTVVLTAAESPRAAVARRQAWLASG
jgi:predicted metalloprotease with PDZ domain